MTDLEIDQLLGGTPCLCGTTDTWHKECFVGLTQEQVDTAYRKVYRKIRAQLREQKCQTKMQKDKS